MPTLHRRRFLRGILLTMTAPALLRAAVQDRDRLPIAFSTLGCPKWDWDTVLRHANEWGFAAIEIRGILGEVDLTKRPEFSAARVAASRQDVQALGLKISDLGASTNLHERDEAKRKKQLDEGRRFIDLAHALGAPFIRVFGNKFLPDESRETTLARVVEGFRLLADQAKGSGVAVLLESHGDFVDSPTLLKILKGANHPNAALLWDAHHTFVAGQEKPKDTFAQLGSFVRHTHLKDSAPAGGKNVKYVLTGDGTVPVRDTVQVLKQAGYKGYYCFEWEKLWHPELLEPEVAFPHFARIMREYLA